MTTCGAILDQMQRQEISVHGSCNRLLRGKNIPDIELELLAGELRFRLETIMSRATEYKDRLGIPFPDCSECDVEKYKVYISKDKGKNAKFYQICRMVLNSELFDGSGEHEGFPYDKGDDYLSMVFCESGWNAQRIKEGIDELFKLRGDAKVTQSWLRGPDNICSLSSTQ